MMKSKAAAIMALALFMLLSTGALFAQEFEKSAVLPLDQAKKTALENSPTLDAARERVTQALERIKQARADRMPSVDLAGSLDHRSPSGEDSAVYYSTELSTTLILFNGFKTKFTELSAEYDMKANREARDEADNLLIWSVASAYYQVQLARENIGIAESDMAYNRKLAEEARVKKKLGTGPLSDVLNFEIQVNGARAALLTAENEYRTALYGLVALMGLPQGLLPPGTEVTELDAEAVDTGIDMDAEVAAALENRPELRQSRYSIKQAEAGIGVAESEYYPEISLFGSVSSTGSDDDDFGSDQSDERIGIKFSINLFSGGKTKSRVREARSLTREAEKLTEEKRLSVISDVRQASDDLLTAANQVSLQETNVALVERTRNLVEKEYRAGQASLVRMNESQNDLTTTRGNLAKARVELKLAKETLNYHTGKNIHGKPEIKATPSPYKLNLSHF